MRKRNEFKFTGTTVYVKDRGEGVIVGFSDRFNTSWIIDINGSIEHIHDQDVTVDGKTLNYLP